MKSNTENEWRLLLSGPLSAIHSWPVTQIFIASEAATAFLETQTMASAGDFVTAVDPVIHHMAAVVRTAIPDRSKEVEHLLHYDVARVYMSGWLGATPSTETDVVSGLIAQLRSWMWDMRSGGHIDLDAEIEELHPASHHRQVAVDPHAIIYIATTAIDRHLQEERDASYRLKIGRIKSLLGVRSSELAHLLGVSREGVRNWDNGAAIADGRWPLIDSLFDTVQRLAQLIKIEALPSVIRRPVPSLDNTTPLDMLMSRRYDDLLAFYENVFRYAVTA